MTALLEVDGLRLGYDGRDVLRGLTLEVRPGEVVALMGRSGAGKTSALRAVAALEPFHGGRIVVDGFALEPGPVPPESRLKPLRRRVGLVFQGHALFAHLSALGLLAWQARRWRFGIRMAQPSQLAESRSLARRVCLG